MPKQPEPIEALNIFGEPIKLQPSHGKHYVQPRGYVCPPGTGPRGETCRTCKNANRMRGGSKRWIKCGLNRARWTGGRATDILARSPACRKWERNADER
jgi:hypothetical protein